MARSEIEQRTQGNNFSARKATTSEYMEKHQLLESPATTWLSTMRAPIGEQLSAWKQNEYFGAPGEIQTPDPLVRSSSHNFGGVGVNRNVLNLQQPPAGCPLQIPAPARPSTTERDRVPQKSRTDMVFRSSNFDPGARDVEASTATGASVSSSGSARTAHGSCIAKSGIAAACRQRLLCVGRPRRNDPASPEW